MKRVWTPAFWANPAYHSAGSRALPGSASHWADWCAAISRSRKASGRTGITAPSGLDRSDRANATAESGTTLCKTGERQT